MSGRKDVEGKSMLDRLTKIRMDQNISKSDDESDGEIDLVTLIHNKCGDTAYDPSSRFTEGFQYARSRGRRKSKEFEDLLLHTATGSLRLSRQSIFLRPKTSSSNRKLFQSLPTPNPEVESTAATSSTPPKPKRSLQRSKSDLGDRTIHPGRQLKVKDADTTSGVSSPGRSKGPVRTPRSPVRRAATPASPSSKRFSRDKHTKLSNVTSSKHQVLK